MAGLSGKQAYWLIGEQTAKGAGAGAFSDKLLFSGGSIAPSHQTDQLAETDSNRNAGDYYVTQTGVEGSPEAYVRDASVHNLLYAALGAIATSDGTVMGTDYVHDITPADTLPYFTFGRMIGDTLWEQFEDCKVSELTISAGAGSPLTAALSVMGRSSVRQASEWAGLPSASSDAVYNFNDAAVTLSSGATSLVSSFELTISNNVTTQQTDDSIPYDVAEGTLAVTLGFDLIFEDLDEYNSFHYGGTAGTTQSSSIYTTDAEFVFSKGTDNELTFTFPKIAYEEFPVDPDPGGDPITVSVRAAAQRDAGGLISAQVKNQVDQFTPS